MSEENSKKEEKEQNNEIPTKNIENDEKENNQIEDVNLNVNQEGNNSLDEDNKDIITNENIENEENTDSKKHRKSYKMQYKESQIFPLNELVSKEEDSSINNNLERTQTSKETEKKDNINNISNDINENKNEINSSPSSKEEFQNKEIIINQEEKKERKLSENYAENLAQKNIYNSGTKYDFDNSRSGEEEENNEKYNEMDIIEKSPDIYDDKNKNQSLFNEKEENNNELELNQSPTFKTLNFDNPNENNQNYSNKFDSNISFGNNSIKEKDINENKIFSLHQKKIQI